MSDERDKQPGAVPQAVSSQQVTAPLPLHHPHATNPWGVPFQPPPATPEPKKERHSYELAFKLIQVALALGTIIYGAGALSEKLRHIDENQKAADARWAEHKRQEDERDERARDDRQRFEKKFDDAIEQVKQQVRGARHGRRREADYDPRP